MKKEPTKDWINKEEYPFEEKSLKLSMGNLHYVDEGSGDPILFVHGNPDWSFSYRHLINHFSKSHRCIAVDHIGFGLSDKPHDWSYLPKAHAENLAELIDHLHLENITLVVNDWSGPIGLSYALNHPDKIQNIVLFNTWMWPTNNDWYYQGFSKFMGGPIGRFLIKKFNFFAKVVIKSAYGDKKKLTPDLHKHFLKPLESPKERKGNWVLPKEIINSGNWIESLWREIDQIKNKPVLILWGEKDIAFRIKELNTWKKTLKNAEVHTFGDAGHYPHEEKREQVIHLMDEFLSNSNEY